MTFERNCKTAHPEAGADIEPGIRWRPVEQAAGKLGAVFSLLKGLSRVRKAISVEGVQLVHARSYPSAFLALWVCRGKPVPWLFDMRGFWVDEKVLKGALKNGSLVFRLLKRLERYAIAGASGIVSLTQKALPRVRELGALDRLPPSAVIPTCVDLGHFALEQREGGAGPLTFGYAGSLGAGYEAGRVAEFLASALCHFPKSRALILTRSDDRAIRPLVEKLSDYEGRVEMKSVSYAEMPAQLSRMDVGLSFITPHPSKHASAATKVAEYLASGVFVVANRGIGDIDETLAGNDVGLAVGLNAEFAAIMKRIDQQLANPATRQRCREYAERHFSVSSGAGQYGDLYRQLLEKPTS